MKRLIHATDTHAGRKEFEKSIYKLAKSIKDNDIDYAVVSGDLTENGSIKQFDLFKDAFCRVWDRLILVPGNHDRLTDDIGSTLMTDRVEVFQDGALYVVKVDTTGEHNKWSILLGHGLICHRVLEEIEAALLKAPTESLVVITFHHHILPLPEETMLERISSYFGYPFAKEIKLGTELIELGKKYGARLYLAGHRHQAYSYDFNYGDNNEKTLSLYNGGCSSRMGRYRMWEYSKHGIVSPPTWIEF